MAKQKRYATFNGTVFVTNSNNYKSTAVICETPEGKLSAEIWNSRYDLSLKEANKQKRRWPTCKFHIVSVTSNAVGKCGRCDGEGMIKCSACNGKVRGERTENVWQRNEDGSSRLVGKTSTAWECGCAKSKTPGLTKCYCCNGKGQINDPKPAFPKSPETLLAEHILEKQDEIDTEAKLWEPQAKTSAVGTPNQPEHTVMIKPDPQRCALCKSTEHTAEHHNKKDWKVGDVLARELLTRSIHYVVVSVTDQHVTLEKDDGMRVSFGVSWMRSNDNFFSPVSPSESELVLETRIEQVQNKIAELQELERQLLQASAHCIYLQRA